MIKEREIEILSSQLTGTLIIIMYLYFTIQQLLIIIIVAIEIAQNVITFLIVSYAEEVTNWYFSQSKGERGATGNSHLFDFTFTRKRKRE